MNGLLAYSAKEDATYHIDCDAVILATGGAGAIFQYHDNPQRMMGEGYALALDVGAKAHGHGIHPVLSPVYRRRVESLPFCFPPSSRTKARSSTNSAKISTKSTTWIKGPLRNACGTGFPRRSGGKKNDRPGGEGLRGRDVRFRGGLARGFDRVEFEGRPGPQLRGAGKAPAHEARHPITRWAAS